MRKPALCICENKDADQLRGNRESNRRLCFRYIDSTIPFLPIHEISSFLPSSVAIQPGLCRTRSKTPKTGFLTTRLILCRLNDLLTRRNDLLCRRNDLSIRRNDLLWRRNDLFTHQKDLLCRRSDLLRRRSHLLTRRNELLRVCRRNNLLCCNSSLSYNPTCTWYPRHHQDWNDSTPVHLVKITAGRVKGTSVAMPELQPRSPTGP